MLGSRVEIRAGSLTVAPKQEPLSAPWPALQLDRTHLTNALCSGTPGLGRAVLGFCAHGDTSWFVWGQNGAVPHHT